MHSVTGSERLLSLDWQLSEIHKQNAFACSWHRVCPSTCEPSENGAYLIDQTGLRMIDNSPLLLARASKELSPQHTTQLDLALVVRYGTILTVICRTVLIE